MLDILQTVRVIDSAAAHADQHRAGRRGPSADHAVMSRTSEHAVVLFLFCEAVAVLDTGHVIETATIVLGTLHDRFWNLVFGSVGIKNQIASEVVDVGRDVIEA